MQYRQEVLLQTLRRVEQTVTAHGELSPFIGTTAYNALIAAISELSTHASVQEAGWIGSRGETARARALRRTLRAIYLQPIVAAARVCARHDPSLASLAMPSARTRTPALLAATLGILEIAHAHEAALIDAGLAPTFLADVDAAVARLRTSLEDRARYRLRRAGATEGLDATTDRAVQVIKIANAQVQLLIGDNLPLLAEWKASIRIPRKPRFRAGSRSVTADTPQSFALSTGTTSQAELAVQEVAA